MRKNIVPLVAICAITTMVLVALSKGIDGVLMTSGASIVAGIAGYKIKIKVQEAKDDTTD